LLIDGTIKRIQRKVVLGPCSKVSERAAYAAFQPYLDAVNVAAAPAPRTGKILQSAVQGSAALLALFGFAMAISFGLKSPLDYSVFSASAGAVLLALYEGRKHEHES
jgi:hypothetical protein